MKYRLWSQPSSGRVLPLLKVISATWPIASVHARVWITCASTAMVIPTGISGFIESAVLGNLLAATAEDSAKKEVYNVAMGDRTTRNDLFAVLKSALVENGVVYE